MSRRFRCWSCKAAFLSDEPSDGPVFCPKCGTRQGPAAEGGLTSTHPVIDRSEASANANDNVFVASGRSATSWKRRLLGFAALLLVFAGGVAVVVAWPALARWWRPRPPVPADPVLEVATTYLHALAEGDTEAARRLGTIDLPPAIRTFRAPRHDGPADRRVQGSFAPIAAFHARVDETFVYDPAIGRFTPRNALGPAAETLDALHEAKEKAEKSDVSKKIESGDPNDLFDAAEALSKTMTSLAEGVLSPKKLIPTYTQLIDSAKPPLPPAERELALDFGRHPARWDALLRRPFLTLRSDGPFVLDRAEVTANVVDTLASSGDPPRVLHLTLTRFRLENINTGWKVTEARREGEPRSDESETAPPPEEVHRSPGESGRGPL